MPLERRNSWESLAAGTVLHRESGQKHAGAEAKLGRWAAAMSDDLRFCVRCGLNDAISPGLCAFHPALVPDPGPLLFGPEWQSCSGGCHAIDQPPCFSRAVHTYSNKDVVKVPDAIQTAGSNSPAPVPRVMHPAPFKI